MTSWYRAAHRSSFTSRSVPAMTPTREEFLHIPVFEQRLFYVLVTISIAIMVVQIAVRIRLWMKGKPGGGSSPALWLGRFWKYVLAQRKVHSSRKRSGAPMHLMLFYGFLSLFIATT